MNDHPEELLAGYADDALPAEERVVVDAHLATCETCREELALATRAQALLGLLADEEVPQGLTGRVQWESRKRPAAAARPRERRYQLVGLAAAAAVVLVFAAVVIPKIGGGLTTGGARTSAPVKNAAAEGGGGAVPTEASPVIVLALQNRVYDRAALTKLAKDLAFLGPFARAEGRNADRPQTDAAVACVGEVLAASDEGTSLQLVRLIRATYENQDAYIAVFLSSPKAGQAPTRALAWAVSPDTCSLITSVSAPV